MSQITSHVLDTSKGRPAEGIKATLYKGWKRRMDRNNEGNN
jgi:5-hydroxyisourate hydrolase-like protein (transthyretin family)